MRHLHRDHDRPRNRLLAALARDDAARLAPFLHEVELDQGQALSRHGEPIDAVYFPHDAVASTLMELPEGESVEVGLMGAEGVAGLATLAGDRIATTTVVCQIAGGATRIAVEDFVREVVSRGGPFHQLLLRYAIAFLGMVAQVGACNASHAVEQRFARWLLLVHDRVGQNEFPLTHEFTALMLGVRRASVTQAAAALRLAGGIEYRNGWVHVRDHEIVHRATCGCYDAIVSMMDRVDGRSRYSFDQ